MQATFTVNIRDIAELRHLQKTVGSLIAIELGAEAPVEKPAETPAPRAGKSKAATSTEPATPPSAAPAPAAAEPSTGAEPPATVIEEVTAEQVTAATLALGKYSKREVIKALLAKFGVERAGLLKPEQRAAYLAEASKHLPVGG